MVTIFSPFSFFSDTPQHASCPTRLLCTGDTLCIAPSILTTPPPHGMPTLSNDIGDLAWSRKSTCLFLIISTNSRHSNVSLSLSLEEEQSLFFRSIFEWKRSILSFWTLHWVHDSILDSKAMWITSLSFQNHSLYLPTLVISGFQRWFCLYQLKINLVDTYQTMKNISKLLKIMRKILKMDWDTRNLHKIKTSENVYNGFFKNKLSSSKMKNISKIEAS
jgi:hypothetical protein